MADSSSPPRKKARDDRGLQFDLCPRTINVTEFVEARALEITQLLAVVDNASLPAGEVAQGPRTFVQRLPRHMRRRAMSYNIKRLPRRARSMAESTIEESKHRKKPPSRRWRRRPRNLLNAYIRRQRSAQWLETHIWHAKRFHMIDHCGWRLPDRSCQRGFRASYRDAVRHCVVQDLSFCVCFELEGPEPLLIDRLNTMCQKSVSHTFSNSKVLSGIVEGRAILYEPEAYPFGCLGTVRFVYRRKIDGNQNRTLWIWTHPALERKLIGVLNRLFKLVETSSALEAKDSSNDPEKASKMIEKINQYHLSKLFAPPTYRSLGADGPVTLRVLKHHLVRLRLTGPKSGLVLSQVLHQPSQSALSSIIETEIDSHQIDQQWEAWNKVYSRADVGVIDSGQIVSLITADPRLFTEYKKQLLEDRGGSSYLEKLPSLGSPLVDSPLWSQESRRLSLETKASDRELNKIRQKGDLISGINLDSLDGKANLIPVMLIQQNSPTFRDHLGMGAGWDLIAPAGWAMPFWIALQYATARAVGLDFQRHFALETADQAAGFPHFWPDTESGRELEEKEVAELKNQYFRRPINRRVDYERLRISHPFQCPWQELVDGWARVTANLDLQEADRSFFVLRDRIALRKLEVAFNTKSAKASDGQNAIRGLCNRHPQALITVRLSSIGKGVPKSKALICLPTKEDLTKLKARRTLNEPESVAKQQPSPKAPEEAKNHIHAESELGLIHLDSGSSGDVEVDLGIMFEDKKEKRLVERRKKEKERKKTKQRQKSGSGGNQKEEACRVKTANSENVIDSCQRRILGYVVSGDFSFATARGQAIGFCSLLALKEYSELIRNGVQCAVLYRNVQSKYYRAALLSIVT